MKWLAKVKESLAKLFGGVSVERLSRTVALLPLGFFVVQYTFMALVVAQPSWQPVLFGLAACYLVAFLGVGSEWFWGRWYAKGLGWWGTLVGAGMLLQNFAPLFMIFTGMHLLVVLMLSGDKVAALYDARQDWRQRYELDEHGAARIGKTVTRAAGSLPLLVFWALAPRQEGLAAMGSRSLGFLAIVVPLLAVTGLALHTRMRSAGVLVLAAGGCIGLACSWLFRGPADAQAWLGVVGSGLLVAAVLPFARPITAFLRGR